MPTALFERLNLKDQREIIVLNAPESFEAELAQLQGITIQRDAAQIAGCPFVLAFVTELPEIERIVGMIAAQTRGDALIWFAYPKGSSKRYRCGFNRDTGWAALGAAGFEGVRQVAIDEDWSALRFRRAEFIKTLTRAPQRRITNQGTADT